jgi:hypothetical protein
MAGARLSGAERGAGPRGAAAARVAGTDRLMNHLVNPVVRRILASPVHDLLGSRVALLTITGRRTGRAFQVPVGIVEDGGGLVVLSRRDRRWWRNLRGGAELTMLAGGRRRPAHATVDRDVSRDEVAGLVARAYAAAGHPVTRERAAALARDRVVIRVVLDAPESARLPLRGRTLWRRWTATVTAGEALGFAVPAVAGAGIAAADPAWPVVAAVVLAAGAAEGAVLGTAQALVVRRAIPAVASRDWIVATVAGAVVAWAIGLLPILAGDRLDELPVPLAVALVVVLGGILVSAMGAFQARVLAPHVPGAGMWVPATALAWLLALGVFMAIATPLWHEGQAAPLVAVIGLAAGVAMAATVAAVSGAALVRLVRSRLRPTRRAAA